MSPPANLTHINADASLTGTAADSNGIQSIQLQVFDGSVFVDTGAPATGAPYDVTFPVAGLTNGATYTFRLKATDTAGNTAFSGQRTLVYDTVTAVPAFTAPADGDIKSATFTISFTNADGAPVTTVAAVAPTGTSSYTTPTSLTSTGPGTFSWATTPPDDGVWDVLLTSRDALNNPVSTAMITITVDNTGPVVGLLTAPGRQLPPAVV